jgi:hypothetical protein
MTVGSSLVFRVFVVSGRRIQRADWHHDGNRPAVAAAAPPSGMAVYAGAMLPVDPISDTV